MEKIHYDGGELIDYLKVDETPFEPGKVLPPPAEQVDPADFERGETPAYGFQDQPHDELDMMESGTIPPPTRTIEEKPVDKITSDPGWLGTGELIPEDLEAAQKKEE